MSKRPLILIVDDEDAIVAGLRYRLSQAGYGVVGALDGREGLDLACAQLPDLILLDECLPGMNGSDIVQALKQHDDTRHIPVVSLSGADVARESPLSAGADAFLRKPYKKDELLDLVESLLAQPSCQDGELSWYVRKPL